MQKPDPTKTTLQLLYELLDTLTAPVQSGGEGLGDSVHSPLVNLKWKVFNELSKHE
jgi:hypothetical protein